MNEQEWARSRPSNIQHGQARRRPMTPARAFWTTVAMVPVVFVLVYGACRVFGSVS